MAGFKIADVYAEVQIKDETGSSIAAVEKRLESIDDRIVQVKAEDNATPVIMRLDTVTPDDKIIQVKAEDDATPVIEKVDSEQPDDVIVPVKADDQTDSVMSGIGGKMKGWAAGLAVGVGGLLAGGLAMGLSQSNIVTGFENQMGATEEVAARYGRVAGKVFGEGFTDSKELVSDALNALSSEMKGFGDVGEEAQARIAGKAVKVSENFGDINTVMQASSNLVSNNLASSFDNAFDLITVGMQNAGAKGDDLLETFREYPGFFDQLGFTGSQALDLINRMMRAGAQDSDKAADAVKEFGIRAVEAGGTAGPAFEELGFKAADMAKTFAGGGDAARDAFIEVVQSLQAVQDPAERAQLAVALFGTQSEDTLVRLLPKLDLTNLGLSNVDGAADRLKSTLTPMEQITNSFGEAIAGLTPIIIPVIKVISGIAGVLSDVVKGIDNVLGMAPKSSGVKVTEVFDRLKKAMSDTVAPADAVNGTLHDLIGSIDGGIDTASKFGASYDDMLSAISGGTAGLEKWNSALAAARAAGGDDAAVMEELNGMLGTIQREYTKAGTAVAEEKSATDGSTDSKKRNTEAARNAANATKEQTDSIYKLQDAILGSINKDIGYRQSVIATKDAQKELTDAVKAHGTKSQEAAEAGLSLESAQVRQAQAARDLAFANSKAATDTGRSADATKAYTAEVLGMAQVAGNNATPALKSMVAGLSQTDLQAAGASRSIDGAGNAIIRLPNGKEIKVEAKDLATGPIEAIANKKYTATVWLYLKEAPAGSSPLSQGRLAEGGPVEGPGTGTSDDVPIMASNGEYMIRERVARKPGVRKLLDLLNNEKLPGFAEGGSIGIGGGGQPLAPSAGPTIFNTYVTAPPDMDVTRLAAKVSRQLELERRNRR